MNKNFELNNFSIFYELLENFAGKDNSTESYMRRLFTENVSKILSTINETEINNEIVDKLNSIIENVINYNLLLQDIYAVLGYQFISLNDFITLFYDVKSDYHESLNKIYTTQITLPKVSGNDDNVTSIADLFVQNITTLAAIDKGVYLVPQIKYSYSSNSSSFKNYIEALEAFYNNQQIKQSFDIPEPPTNIDQHTSIKFKNKQFQSLMAKLISDYNNKMCFIYLLDNEKMNESLLVFLKNFTFSQEDETLHNIYKENSQLLDIGKSIGRLSTEIYRLYYRDQSYYENRNLIFEPANYIYQLEPDPVEDITINSFGYNLIISIITNNTTSIKAYINEFKKFKTYIENIYNSAISSTENKIMLGG